MTWLKKKRICPTAEQQRAQYEELKSNKNAIQKSFHDAKESNKHVLNLLEENHFHIKLYVAAGGRPRMNGVKK